MRKYSHFLMVISQLITFQFAFAESALSVRLPEKPFVLTHQQSSLTSSHLYNSEKIIEFTLSSWSPQQLELDSFMNDASAFTPGMFPTVSANLLFPTNFLSSIPGVSLVPEVGISFLQMTRTGTLKFSGFLETTEQVLALIPLRIGVRLQPQFIRLKKLTPYLGFKLLPTAALSPKCAMSDGKPVLGLPVQLTLGSEFRILNTQMNLGIESTFGSLHTQKASGNFFGLGISIGIQLKTEKNSNESQS